MNSGRLPDKVALITGAGSGISRAMAVEFAREGADVIVHYLDDRSAADSACHEVEAVGRRAVALPGDVNDEDQVEMLFDRAVETFGRVDILVNSAGADVSGAHCADPTTEERDRILRTNFFGAYFCCRRFVPAEGRSSTSRRHTRRHRTREPPGATTPRVLCGL